MGVEASAVEAALPVAAATGEAPAFEVWPENANALEVFLALDTNWRFHPRGVPLGLDYAALFGVMRALRVRERRAVFEDVRVMERAVLDALGEVTA